MLFSTSMVGVCMMTSQQRQCSPCYRGCAPVLGHTRQRAPPEPVPRATWNKELQLCADRHLSVSMAAGDISKPLHNYQVHVFFSLKILLSVLLSVSNKQWFDGRCSVCSRTATLFPFGMCRTGQTPTWTLHLGLLLILFSSFSCQKSILLILL